MKPYQELSSFVNVSWHKAHKKWQVSFSIQGKKKHFGYFATEEAAAARAKQVRQELVGDQ